MSQPSHVVSGKSHLGILMMLAWPAILEQLLLTLVRYVDTAMVGSLGANATAAVAINASPTWLISSILSAIGVGYSVQVAHSIGAKDKQATARIVRQALLAVLFMGISIMLICLLIAPHLPKWMGAQPDVLPNAVRYLQIYVLSLPFQCGSYTFSAVLRCMGDTKTPLILNTAANLLNVVLNFFLIFPTRPTELLECPSPSRVQDGALPALRLRPPSPPPSPVWASPILPCSASRTAASRCMIASSPTGRSSTVRWNWVSQPLWSTPPSVPVRLSSPASTLRWAGCRPRRSHRRGLELYAGRRHLLRCHSAGWTVLRRTGI